VLYIQHALTISGEECILAAQFLSIDDITARFVLFKKVMLNVTESYFKSTHDKPDISTHRSAFNCRFGTVPAGWNTGAGTLR
ncbi:hypothetical protein KKB28_01270, partial [bacterium]|nr:hypothetical protein [bacterium]